MSIQPALITNSGTISGLNARLAEANRRLARLEANRAGGGSGSGGTGPIDGSRIINGTLSIAALQAGSITAEYIDAGAINADHIQANAIQTIHLDANVVTANELAVNAVYADAIQANAVTTVQLAAGSVYAENIAVDQVEAQHINVATLDAIATNMGSITGGTITGGTIQTNTSGSRVVIDGLGLRGYAANGTTLVFEINVGTGVASFTGVAQLQAGSVVPGAYLSGFVPPGSIPAIGGANLLPDSSFDNDSAGAAVISSSWTAPVGGVGSRDTTVKRPGSVASYKVVGNNTNVIQFNSGLLPIQNKKHVFSYYVKNTSGAANRWAFSFIAWYDAANALISVPMSTATALTTSTTEWQRHSHMFEPPANATQAVVYVRVAGDVNATVAIPNGEVWHFDDAQLEQGEVLTAYAPKPSEILPGSITEPDIRAGAITTEKMTANTINGDRVAAGTLNASKIVSESIDTLQMKAGAVKTNILDAGAVTAQKINIVFGTANMAPNARFDLWSGTISGSTRLSNEGISDPGFESGTTAMWSMWNGGGARSSAWAASGVYSLQMTTNTMGTGVVNQAWVGGPYTDNDPEGGVISGAWGVAAGQKWSAAAAVNVTARTGNARTYLQLFWFDANGTSIGSVTSNVVAATGVNRLVIDGAVAPTNAVFAQLWIMADGGSPASGTMTASFDNLMMVQSEFAVDFFTGTLGGVPDYWQRYDNAPSAGKMTVWQKPNSGPTALNSVKIKYSGATAPKGMMTLDRVEQLANKHYVLSFYYRGTVPPWIAGNALDEIRIIDYPTVSSTVWQRYAFRIKSSTGGYNGTGTDWIYLYGLYFTLTGATKVDGTAFGNIVGATAGEYELANVQYELGEIVTGFSPSSGGAPGSVGTTQIGPEQITTDKILARTILAGDISTGTLTANEIAGTTITANKMNVATLGAISAQLGTITSGTITGAFIRTAVSGGRLELDWNGFRQYASDGSTILVNLPASGAQATFRGAIQARAMTMYAEEPSVRMIHWVNAAGSSSGSIESIDTTATGNGYNYLEMTAWRARERTQVILRANSYSPDGYGDRFTSIVLGSSGWPYSTPISTVNWTDWRFSNFANNHVWAEGRLRVGGWAENNGAFSLALDDDGGPSYGIVCRSYSNTAIYADGQPGAYAIYASGNGGTAYGPFTGVHDARLSGSAADYVPGMIVASTGDTYRDPDDLSSTLPQVELATKQNAKAVFGVFVTPLDFSFIDDQYDYEPAAGEAFGGVNALGDGQIMVCDLAGEVENGDFITPSELPGIGERQSDDLLRSSTVAKATQDSNFADEPVAFTYNGVPVKVKLVSCTYHCG